MAAPSCQLPAFASLLDRQTQCIPDNLVNTWVELPRLDDLPEGRLPICRTKELESFAKFPGLFLVRRDSQRRWNQMAQSLAGRRRSGNLGLVLSGPSGIGKSTEALFFAALARQLGWLVSYIGNSSGWILNGDPQTAALQWMKMLLVLNGSRLQQPLAEDHLFDVRGTEVRFSAPQTLHDLLTFGAAEQLLAEKVSQEVQLELCVWVHTPVLRVVDEHNELWKRFGSDTAKWPHYFQQYANFDALAGCRDVMVFSGSQHNEFEVAIPSAYQKFIQCLQPFTAAEFEALSMHPHYPDILRANEAQVVWLTNRMPRDVTLLVECCQYSATMDATVKAYRSCRYTKLQSTLEHYIDNLSDRKLKIFSESLRQILLPASPAFDLPPSFLDRGLVYKDTQTLAVVPVNFFARDLLVKTLFRQSPSLDHSSLVAHIFLSEQLNNSVRGGAWEELVVEALLFHDLYLHYVDEYGSASSSVRMHAQDLVTLLPGQLTPTQAPTVPTLFRGFDGYPVWDFIYVGPSSPPEDSTVVFIQTSVSSFRDHDGGSSEICRSFTEAVPGRNLVELWLDASLGVSGHCATHDVATARFAVQGPSGQAMRGVHFLYVTAGDPRRATGGRTPKYTDMGFLFVDQLPPPLQRTAMGALRHHGRPAVRELDSMSREELVNLCDKNGLEPRKRKAECLQAVKDHFGLT